MSRFAGLVGEELVWLTALGLLSYVVGLVALPTAAPNFAML